MTDKTHSWNAAISDGLGKPWRKSPIVVTFNPNATTTRESEPEPYRRQVTREEFDAFIATYPRPLKRDVYAIADPPWCNYHDFTIGEGWDSLVAGVHLKHEPARGEHGPNEYWIFVEHVQP